MSTDAPHDITSIATPAATDTALKQKHRAMWASGDYPAVADVIAPLGARLADAIGAGPGIRLVDVAAGAGNVAVPAARAGAHVVATDLTPELLSVGESRHRDLPIVWRTADAEDLPFDDGAFDAATSCVGVMFAPDHQRCADELLRVCRRGGRIGLINWTPEGFIGELFTTMRPFMPTPPPGTVPGIRWGSEAYVRELFGDRPTSLSATTETLPVTVFDSGTRFRDFFRDTYGPTISAHRNTADSPERTAELDDALVALGDRHLVNGAMEWEYLLVTITVRRAGAATPIPMSR